MQARSFFTVFALAAAATAVHAQDKVSILTSWYAQAEHGGYYQALATGIYKKYGLDVTVKMGGPQVNSVQLIAAGQADFIMGKDFQTLSAIEQGVPLVTVAALFQKEPQGMVTHPDVNGLGDLKDKTVLLATSGRSSWWPWLKIKYGYKDEQTRPYSFSMQPFFADKSVVQQGFPTSETFIADKAGQKVKFFLFADDGYPPYGNTIVTTQKMAKDKPDVVQRFVKATIEGYKSYLDNPAPGNALIKQENPKMEDDLIAYGVRRMKEINFLGAGDAARMGVGIMTDARWKQTYDLMVTSGQVKPIANWQQAYTTQFVKDLKVMP
ncbi:MULTISPECIES: ABC transporter substrate-binding protein [Ramlibacter]|uniref:ABC transporter substrate-binding protein n=1 Tax=Ramlibacter pinisoli TaxID=2682844 RepID=A0A6N8IWH9_9BURK|nr:MULTISPECIES: ABC transporter substrate-binding protein [Ramlibacter]MBA2961242.1 ABC transporter substrate-binding protein [Ramlibacter sp. CGMCC 1.13660]MVQ31187.1 ABC transporter substrate-binding protein [Ramlibacter pinisoli]